MGRDWQLITESIEGASQDSNVLDGWEIVQVQSTIENGLAL